MGNNTIGLPSGFRDILFEEARSRRAVEAKLATLFDERGYGEVLPSGVEFYDVYTRGNQSLKDSTFKFLDREDHLLALRADFTPAIARIVAAGALGDALPYRVWYAGSVYRKADHLRGRFSEVRQIGLELVGRNSVEADIEVLDLAMSCFASLGIRDIQLHLNHAGIFRGIIKSLELTPEALCQLKVEIDRKDLRRIATSLERYGVDASLRSQLDAVCRCVGGFDALERLGPAIRNQEARESVDALANLAKRLGRWQENIVFDLTEIDEMEYYTGVMASFLSPSSTAEVGKGGRYDTLVQEFGRLLPAIGVSLDVERLAELEGRRRNQP